jgi:HlyD family secretion protein
MKNKRFVIILILAALAGGGYYVYARLHAPPTDRIILSGNIELTEINMAFKVSGKLIERAVDEGDTVKKGMIVARLDHEQAGRSRDREDAALSSARDQLTTAQTAVAWERQTMAADIEQRRADLQNYEQQYLQLKNGSRPQEIQDAAAAVSSATSEADRARSDWERAQTLFKNDDISRQQYDQFRRNSQTAEAALKSAKEREALVVIGPRPEAIAAAEAQVRRAAANLKMAEANELELRRREDDVKTRQSEIARQQAQLQVAVSQLDDTVIASPIDGVVLVKAADVGEVLAPGATVVTLGDIEHPWVRGYIGEKDLPRVHLGDRVNVTTDGVSEVFNGHISFISSEAEFTPKQIQTQEERVKLVYRIKIEVENPKRVLKLNMPVDAEIVLKP